MFLNNQWINDQIKAKIKYMETTENNNSTPQNMWDAAIQAYLKKEEQSQMNNLNSQLMKLEKEEQMRP